MAKLLLHYWELVAKWKCYFYVTDGWKVYPNFIPDGTQIISKTYSQLGVAYLRDDLRFWHCIIKYEFKQER